MSIPHYQECVRAGMKLIPLNGKAPFYKDWQNENDQNRVTDPEDGRLHAYDMGWQIPPGWCVVDVDKPHAFDYSIMEGHTASQITQSGGSHYLCKLPKGVRPDYSHEWGEILTFPKQIRIYHLSDDWLRKVIEPLPQAFWGTSASGNGSKGLSMSVPEDLTTLPEEGNRNNWLTAKAGELWNTHGIHAVEKILALNEQIGLPESEVHGIIGQLPKWERTPPEGEYEPSEAQFITAQQLRDMELAPVSFWIPGRPWGPQRSIMLHGRYGSGKSLWMLREMEALDQKVCIVDGELHLNLLQQRLSPTANNISFHHWPETNAFMHTDYSQFDMLVVDTVAGLYSGPKDTTENDIAYWVPLNTWLRDISKELCVMLIHHSGKDSTLGARGSSEAMRQVDQEIAITNDGQGTYTVAMGGVLKNRLGMTPIKDHLSIETNGGYAWFENSTAPKMRSKRTGKKNPFNKGGEG